MMITGPVLRAVGEYGVIAFSGEKPNLDFLDECTLDYWFRNRWIPRQSAPKPLYTRGNGTICDVYDMKPIAGLELTSRCAADLKSLRGQREWPQWVESGRWL
jgi:hypothetical protein